MDQKRSSNKTVAAERICRPFDAGETVPYAKGLFCLRAFRVLRPATLGTFLGKGGFDVRTPRAAEGESFLFWPALAFRFLGHGRHSDLERMEWGRGCPDVGGWRLHASGSTHATLC